jgi:anti-sigma regulatory factor (Ser/Thr protein kinase)
MDHVTYHTGAFAFSGRVTGSVAATFNSLAFGPNHLHKELILDFTNVQAAFANAMVTIILACRSLRGEGFHIDIVLPRDRRVAHLFRGTGWAHFLSPATTDLEDRVVDRHVPLRAFRTSAEQSALVTRTVDIVLSQTRLGKDLANGFDWLLQEISDNVLCHAEARDGGLLQLVTTATHVDVIVADGGRGIPDSMRDINTRLDDCAAVEEAAKQGVTSKPTTNQGNGLAGTLNVACASGGQLTITSGRANIWWDAEGGHRQLLPYQYSGTVVDIRLGRKPFDARVALALGGNLTERDGHIEFEYWDDTERAFRIKLRKEQGGVASRQAGSALRTKIENIIEHDPQTGIIIDWEGIERLPSSSFVDEAFAKLRLGLGADRYREILRHQSDSEEIRWAVSNALSKRPA